MEGTIIIGTHGDFGKALIKSAEMILGKLENVKFVSLKEGQDPDQYYVAVESVLKESVGNVLCLVDIFGGTPSHTFLRLSQKYNFKLCGGLNLPMLINACDQRADKSEWNLSEIVSSSQNNIFDILERFNNRK